MSIKQFLIGTPIESIRESEQRLTKTAGLAVFSSDALSSVAYATDEILLALIIVGTGFLNYSIWIALMITALMIIVAISYQQTIREYPSGGGAYIVAKENLGDNFGIVAGVALLIDYVLTVTVSISAGIAAITSAFPEMFSHTVMFCLISLCFIMFVNLRGVKESGKAFSLPTYFFIVVMFLLIIFGVKNYIMESHQAVVIKPVEGISWVYVFILLKAFASGCAALTGIEAVANGVKAFKPPESQNARITLGAMVVILATMFMGITFLADFYNIIPNANETVLSQLSKAVFSKGLMYYGIQFGTALILILAANTSFADFPRLSSIMAADRFLPRQLSNRGDKLVFSNGIILLGFFSALLIILFNGDTHMLIPLYAVGVFTAFTLSQAGMVQHWRRFKGKGWIKGIIINGLGTITTAVVLLIIAFEKFAHGAWIVIVAIPALVLLVKNIHKHYISVGEQLAIKPDSFQMQHYTHHSVIIPISGLHQAVISAVKYAKTLSKDVFAVYVCIDPEATKKIKATWDKLFPEVSLIVLESPYRSITQPLLEFIDEVHQDHPNGIITVILPELVPSKWWHHLLHNNTAIFIKGLLLFKKDIVSTSLPFHLK
jgi:amino acid transporter